MTEVLSQYCHSAPDLYKLRDIRRTCKMLMVRPTDKIFKTMRRQRNILITGLSLDAATNVKNITHNQFIVKLLNKKSLKLFSFFLGRTYGIEMVLRARHQVYSLLYTTGIALTQSFFTARPTTPPA